MSAFDLFVSYKTEDVNFVRPIVEALRAAGIKVWFAEYNVLLENYERFQAEIDAGIDAAEYFLAFTNDRWVESPYCQIEMERIQRRGVTPERVIEICIPRTDSPQQMYSVFEDPRFEYSDDDVATLDHIASRARILQKVAKPTTSKRQTVNWEDAQTKCQLSLDLPPLTQIQTENTKGAARLTRAFRGKVGAATLRLNVFVSPNKCVAANLLDLTAGEQVDDRALYSGLREYAQQAFVKPYGLDVFGLHLMHGPRGAIFALSYAQQEDDAWYLCRRYAVPVGNSATRPMGEVDVQFVIEASNREDRSNFYALGRFMDETVATLKYTEPELLIELGGRLTHKRLAFPIQLRQGWEAIPLLPEFGDGFRVRPDHRESPYIDVVFGKHATATGKQPQKTLRGDDGTVVNTYEADAPSDSACLPGCLWIFAGIAFTIYAIALSKTPAWCIALVDIAIVAWVMLRWVRAATERWITYEVQSPGSACSLSSSSRTELEYALGPLMRSLRKANDDQRS